MAADPLPSHSCFLVPPCGSQQANRKALWGVFTKNSIPDLKKSFYNSRSLSLVSFVILLIEVCCCMKGSTHRSCSEPPCSGGEGQAALGRRGASQCVPCWGDSRPLLVLHITHLVLCVRRNAIIPCGMYMGSYFGRN